MSEFENAKKRAMYLLGRKDYSRKELADKLKSTYSAEISEQAAELMCEYGYIDDKRYARRLARSCIESRRYGKSRARLMMRQKGLDDETIEEALSEYSADEQTEMIAGLIEQRYIDRLFLDGIEGKKELQKVIAALARRGYGFGEIKAAIQLVQERMEDEE